MKPHVFMQSKFTMPPALCLAFLVSQLSFASSLSCEAQVIGDLKAFEAYTNAADEIKFEKFRAKTHSSLRYWQSWSGTDHPAYMISNWKRLRLYRHYLEQIDRAAIANLIGELFRTVEYAFYRMRAHEGLLKRLQQLEIEVTSKNEMTKNIRAQIDATRKKLQVEFNEQAHILGKNIDEYDMFRSQIEFYLQDSNFVASKAGIMLKELYDTLGDKRAWKKYTAPTISNASSYERRIDSLSDEAGILNAAPTDVPSNGRPTRLDVWEYVDDNKEAAQAKLIANLSAERRAATLNIALQGTLIRFYGKSIAYFLNKIPGVNETEVVQFLNYLLDQNARLVQFPKVDQVLRVGRLSGDRGAAEQYNLLKELSLEGLGEGDLLLRAWYRRSDARPQHRIVENYAKTHDENFYEQLIASQKYVADKKLPELSNLDRTNVREFVLTIAGVAMTVGLPVAYFIYNEDDKKNDQVPSATPTHPEMSEKMLQFLKEKSDAGDAEAKNLLNDYQKVSFRMSILNPA